MLYIPKAQNAVGVLGQSALMVAVSFADNCDDKSPLCYVFRHNVKCPTPEGNKPAKPSRDRYDSRYEPRSTYDVLDMNAALPIFEQALLGMDRDDDPHDQLYSISTWRSPSSSVNKENSES